MTSKEKIYGDQFYTKEKTAQNCLAKLTERIDVNSFDIIIEPSAGTGSFYNLLPVDKRIGIDLEPDCEGIIEMDYLDFEPLPNQKILVVGNPPFGVMCKSAVLFFKHSAKFADIIAFIIPRTFKRISIQNRLSLDFELIYTEDLPTTPCCFTPKMGAKCCFQIWQKTSQLKTKD